MEETIQNSMQTPDFGSSFIDAFKAEGGLQDIAAGSEGGDSIEPVEKPKTTSPKLSRAEKDVERLFSVKEAAVTEESSATKDSDIPQSIKSTKAADAFRKIKEEKAQLSKQLDELKLAKTSNQDLDSKFKTLQEERDTLSERVRLLDIERHPNFVKKYESKITGVFDSMKSVVGTEGDRLIGLLKSPENEYRNSQIDDIVDNLSASKKAKLGALIVRYDEINGEKSSEMSEAKSDYDAVISRYKEENDSNTASALESATKTWTKVSSDARALEIFEPRDNDDEWNVELNGRLNLARQIFNGENSEEDLAKAALWAAAAPKYRELLYSQVEVNKRLTAELAKYRGNQPGVASRSGISNNNPKSDASKSENFVANVMKSLGR